MTQYNDIRFANLQRISVTPVAGLTQILLESSMQAKFLISMTAKRHFGTKLPAGTSGTGQSAMTSKLLRFRHVAVEQTLPAVP